MIHSTTIEDLATYVPATDVGRHFGYTKDYILLLIKQDKIKGRKIGHKWYACMDSAEQFFTIAKTSREKWRKKVSEERKSELRLHKQVVEGNDQSPITRRQVAYIETLAVVVIGLSFGVSGYFGVVPQTQTGALYTGVLGFFENIARSLYSSTVKDTVSVMPSVTEVTTQTHLDKKVVKMEHEGLIIAPVDQFSTSSVAIIAESFSDPVDISVDKKNPNTGIITPVFKDGDGDAYRFLMVPLQMKADETKVSHTNNAMTQ